MKLRLRSSDSKETLKVEVPTPTSLEHLKSLISPFVSASASTLRLSLNRRDDLTSLASLSSGDLLFFTIQPLASDLPAPPADPELEPEPEPEPEPSAPTPEPMSSFSIPGFLKRVIEAEASAACGSLDLLVIAMHAVFLESGFLIDDAARGLPVASNSPVISVAYTVPNAVEPVRVKVSLVGKFANVYGSMRGGADVYRVCLNAERFVPAIASCLGELSKRDEFEIFEMWKMLKDGLSLPLLIDTCERNGLPSPPCFMRLPTELKIRVLELLSGVDLARIGCVSSELWYLSSIDDLWAKKILEEFGYEWKGLFGERWKNQFVTCWKKRQRDTAARQRAYRPRMPPFWDRRVPFPPPRYNIIGGDYDRFPAIGGGLSGGRAGQAFPRTLARQSFSPNCNLGSFHG